MIEPTNILERRHLCNAWMQNNEGELYCDVCIPKLFASYKKRYLRRFMPENGMICDKCLGVFWGEDYKLTLPVSRTHWGGTLTVGSQGNLTWAPTDMLAVDVGGKVVYKK